LEVYTVLRRIAPGMTAVILAVSGKRREELTIKDVEEALKKLNYSKRTIKIITSILARRTSH